jgi:hypothetical protein
VSGILESEKVGQIAKIGEYAPFFEQFIFARIFPVIKEGLGQNNTGRTAHPPFLFSSTTECSISGLQQPIRWLSKRFFGFQ